MRETKQTYICIHAQRQFFPSNIFVVSWSYFTIIQGRPNATLRDNCSLDKFQIPNTWRHMKSVILISYPGVFPVRRQTLFYAPSVATVIMLCFHVDYATISIIFLPLCPVQFTCFFSCSCFWKLRRRTEKGWKKNSFFHSSTFYPFDLTDFDPFSVMFSQCPSGSMFPTRRQKPWVFTQHCCFLPEWFSSVPWCDGACPDCEFARGMVAVAV